MIAGGMKALATHISSKIDLQGMIASFQRALGRLANSKFNLLTASQNLDPKSPVLKQMETRIERMSVVEKRIETQKRSVEQRLSSVLEMIKGVAGMIKQDTQSFFTNIFATQ